MSTMTREGGEVDPVRSLYWTSAYSLTFYLLLTSLVNVTKFDA